MPRSCKAKPQLVGHAIGLLSAAEGILFRVCTAGFGTVEIILAGVKAGVNARVAVDVGVQTAGVAAGVEIAGGCTLLGV